MWTLEREDAERALEELRREYQEEIANLDRFGGDPMRAEELFALIERLEGGPVEKASPLREAA